MEGRGLKKEEWIKRRRDTKESRMMNGKNEEVQMFTGRSTLSN